MPSSATLRDYGKCLSMFSMLSMLFGKTAISILSFVSSTLGLRNLASYYSSLKLIKDKGINPYTTKTRAHN
jgi:hypothetical protein